MISLYVDCYQIVEITRFRQDFLAYHCPVDLFSLGQSLLTKPTMQVIERGVQVIKTLLALVVGHSFDFAAALKIVFGHVLLPCV